MRLGFITCANLKRFSPSKDNPLFTRDDQVLADYLTSEGFSCEPLLWGTPLSTLTKNGPHILIMRSPWDYTESIAHSEKFFLWLKEIYASKNLIMINHPSIMLWNLDKRYLIALMNAGVSIVPTSYITPNDVVDFSSIIKEKGPIVLKPAVGAGGKDVTRLFNFAEAENFATSMLHQNRTFLLQPFIKEIMTAGEWSLIFIDGDFSHAVWKRPACGHWLVHDEHGGSVDSAEPPPLALSLAHHTIACLPRAFTESTDQPWVKPLYARVDIIATKDKFLVSELELVEPELFFLNRGKISHTKNVSALARFQKGLTRIIEESRK